jgi:hypothetical protein
MLQPWAGISQRLRRKNKLELANGLRRKNNLELANGLRRKNNLELANAFGVKQSAISQRLRRNTSASANTFGL